MLLLAIGTMSGIYAKYYSEKDYEDTVNADSFYFTVDLLGDTNEVGSTSKTLDLYGGGKQVIKFNVQNYFDSKRITPTDIDYTVSYKFTAKDGSSTYNSFSVSDVGAGADALEKTSASLKLTKNVESKKQFEVVLNKGYNQGDILEITIHSTAPYKKTLTLTLVMHSFSADVLYYVKDQQNSDIARLIIECNVAIPKESIKIDWSNINATTCLLDVDTTSNYILDDDFTLTKNNPNNSPSGHLNYAWITQPIKAVESIEIKFFKADKTKNYSYGSSNSSISAIESNGQYFITLTENAS